MRRPFESEAVILDDLSRDGIELYTKQIKGMLEELNYFRQGYRIVLLSGTEKSAVWKVEPEGEGQQAVIIKIHMREGNYEREIMGYRVLRGGSLPRLLHTDKERRVLILEYIEGRMPKSTKGDVELIVRAYASLHEVGSENITAALGPARCNHDALGGSEELRKYHDVLPGNENRYPLSVGDVKPEHVLIRNEQAYIVDFETISFQRSEWFDVVSIQCFFSEKFEKNIDWLIVKYMRCRGIDATSQNCQSAREYIDYLMCSYLAKKD